MDKNVSLVAIGVHFSMLQTDEEHDRQEQSFPPFIPEPLWGVLRRLDMHCDSDESLWDALISGCLLDRGIDWHAADGLDIADWWGPDDPLPTLESVVADWQTAWTRAVCLDRRGQEASEVDVGVRDILDSYLVNIEFEAGFCQRALVQAIEAGRRVEDHKSTFESLMYDGTA